MRSHTWGVWRDGHAASTRLRQWAERLAARRGKRVAVVALARRLSGILFALGRDDTPSCRNHVGTTFGTGRVAA